MHHCTLAPIMAIPNPQDADLRASDLKLLETENFADAEIICQGKTFKIHKAVVCTRSVWFDKALNGPFEVRERRIQVGQATNMG